MKPYPYQENAINECSLSFKNYKSIILCAPTGSGKTIMFSEIVKRAVIKNTCTLVLTNRIELLKQAAESIKYEVEEISANSKYIHTDKIVYVAMVQTLINRIKNGLTINPKLIIIDECHIGSFNKILELYPDALKLGCTATPEGKHIPLLYQKMVFAPSISKLIQMGFLVDYIPYQMIDDFSDLDIVKGEFTISSLMAHFDKPKLYSGVVENWLKYGHGKKTIVFCVNIQHTINTYNSFQAAGINAGYITSNTPDKERPIVLEQFKSGHITVLVNCGILTTGYNEPSIECVVINRATLSRPLFHQMIGRGSRTYLDKQNFICLDFGQNHKRHGMWNEDIEWTLEQKKIRPGVAPVKDCTCGALILASAKLCKYCGHKFEFKKSGPESGIMAIVEKPKDIKKLTVDELIKLEFDGVYKAQYIWRILRYRDIGQLKEYAEKKGFSKGWVFQQLKLK